jgi:hypothetical protein
LSVLFCWQDSFHLLLSVDLFVFAGAAAGRFEVRVSSRCVPICEWIVSRHDWTSYCAAGYALQLFC